ncbi:hypothetical protein Tco_0538662 [Tanacetum coccineum]
MYGQLHPYQMQDIDTEIRSQELLMILQDDFASLQDEHRQSQKMQDFGRKRLISVRIYEKSHENHQKRANKERKKGRVNKRRKKKPRRKSQNLQAAKPWLLFTVVPIFTTVKFKGLFQLRCYLDNSLDCYKMPRVKFVYQGLSFYLPKHLRLVAMEEKHKGMRNSSYIHSVKLAQAVHFMRMTLGNPWRSTFDPTAYNSTQMIEEMIGWD